MLLTPGYFQSTFFPKSYWVTDYWPEYGLAALLAGKVTLTFSMAIPGITFAITKPDVNFTLKQPTITFDME